MEQPLVTVITVVYNIVENGRKDFLLQNFESVHNQTYKNIEHLVIDGASTDGTIDLLKQYEKKGWIRFISEPDQGPYDAMNKGIFLTKSEYVIILNSDDLFYDENVVKIQMMELLRTNADYAFGDTVFVDIQGRENKLIHPFDSSLFFQKGDNMHLFWRSIPFNHEGCIMKKNIMKKVGYFDNQSIYGVSTDFKLEIDFILNDFKYVYIPYNFIYFRMGGVSSNVYSVENILEYFYSKFYPLKGSEKNFYTSMSLYPTRYFIFCLRNFMKQLHLKNFDYDKFCSALENQLKITRENILNVEDSQNSINSCVADYKKYYFLGLPIMKVKKDARGSKHYKLFNFLPIFKIKNDAKGGKTYKLFSFLPLWRVKSK